MPLKHHNLFSNCTET